nr:oncostatin-M isoform X5 [Chrysemys picta bellii]
MDLQILEHRVRVLSLARRGLWLYTHPLLKLLLLPRRSRCKFFSLTETPEDYTIMLDEEGFKAVTQGLFIQCLAHVNSSPAPCRGCHRNSLDKITAKTRQMEKEAKELFRSYLTHQGLLASDLRRLCDEAVQWFPTENITDQPKVVMLQELYRTLVHMKDALENIGKQQQVLSTPGAALPDKLQNTQWAVRGLLSNTGCALCLEGVSPNSRHTPERPAATNAFQQKIDGCKVLRNWQKFLEKLARGSVKKAPQALRDQRKRRKGTKRKEGSSRS